MESLLIMAVVWFVFSSLTKNSKKKQEAQKAKQRQAQQPDSRRQQAIEEQRRRRAAYEDAQEKQFEKDQALKTMRIFGTAQEIEAAEKAEAEAKAAARAAEIAEAEAEAKAAALAEVELYVEEPHHIDEEEERRCAEATAKKEKERKIRVSEKALERELLQRYGSLEGRPSQKQRPLSLEQAQRQLHTPAGTSQPAQAQPKQRTQRQVGQAVDLQNLAGLENTSGNTWVQGIVMAEILGPPRAKKRQVR